jgi:hypothetical protein
VIVAGVIDPIVTSLGVVQLPIEFVVDIQNCGEIICPGKGIVALSVALVPCTLVAESEVPDKLIPTVVVS